MSAGLTILSGCIFETDGSNYYTNGSEGYNYKSNITESVTDTYDGTTGMFTVEPTTKYLTLKGVNGKTLYLAHTNPTNKNLYGTDGTYYVRVACVFPGFESNISANVSRSASDELLTTAIQETVETAPLNADAIIYNMNLKAIQSEKSLSRNVSASYSLATDSNVKNYSDNDTESFNYYRFETDGTYSFQKDKTFKLLSGNADYNIWVEDSDSTYKDNESKFKTAALAVGSFFISGYKIVKEIYGEAASYIYDYQGGYQKYAPMSTYSRTGEKINIMLADLGIAGILGYHNTEDITSSQNSNIGRFIYIHSPSLIDSIDTAKTTSLHEFSHLISATQKTMEHGQTWSYWYGELLAMLCEEMMQDYLGIDNNDFSMETGKVTLSISPKARLSTANFCGGLTGLTGQTVYTYAATFQFGTWLVRKFGGISFLKKLATNGYVDFESILRAIKDEKDQIYSVDSLLQEYAGDLLTFESGSPLNQKLTCTCGDDNSTYTYNFYPINLWDSSHFYDWTDVSKIWCDSSNEERYTKNKTCAISLLPDGNIFSTARKEYTTTPYEAYIGPAMLKTSTIFTKIGPYGYSLNYIGKAQSESVTIQFAAVSDKFADTLTVWVK